MKVWSREFTRTEKVLLLILAVILVGLVYYQFVHRPVQKAIDAAEAEYSALQTEYTVAQAKADQLRKLGEELENMKDSGSASYMASYNNAKAEVALLNDILSDTGQYNISFANVTRSGNQIRRNFTLQFRTKDYETMRNVIDGLLTSPYRCLVGDIQCSMGQERNGADYVSANVTATFFETMEGGTPDAGLPEDRGTAK